MTNLASAVEWKNGREGDQDVNKVEAEGDNCMTGYLSRSFSFRVIDIVIDIVIEDGGKPKSEVMDLGLGFSLQIST